MSQGAFNPPMPRRKPTEAERARGARIRDRREAVGLTHKQVADKFGITQSAISQWESGATAPKPDQLPLLADALNTSIHYILTGEAGVRQISDATAPSISVIRESPLTVPVFGTVRGGSDGDFILQGEVVEHVRRLPGIESLKDTYALYIVGDSMTPWATEGDLIYVTATRPPFPGCKVVVQTQDPMTGVTTGALIKAYEGRTDKVLKLSQYNPVREVVIPLTKVKSVHRVLTLRELVGS